MHRSIASQKKPHASDSEFAPAQTLSNMEKKPSAGMIQRQGHALGQTSSQCQKGTCATPAFDHDFSQIPLHVQPKLTVNPPGDKYEREADRVADQVMGMREQGKNGVNLSRANPSPSSKESPSSTNSSLQRKCSGCEAVERIQMRESSNQAGRSVPAVVHKVLASPGRPLDTESRSFFEPRFGQDFSHVRVHTDASAASSAKAIQAQAYTSGRHVVFGQGKFSAKTNAGRHLLAHELTHVIQQGQGTQRQVQREPEQTVDQDESTQPAAAGGLNDPLSAREWELVEMWQSLGNVGGTPLTEDPAHNALVVAEAIFCSRSLGMLQGFGDPLLCIDSNITRAHPMVRDIAGHVASRGAIINWTAVPVASRMVYVMERLVNDYGFPVNGAAGLVGNLRAESGVLPTSIERAPGGRIPGRGPLTERNFAGDVQNFTATEVMNRDSSTNQGPRMPGVGLAQWTGARRPRPFQHTFNGEVLGAAILFNMDAQIDFLVNELQDRYHGVYQTLTQAGVSLNDASDEVVYSFEIPGSILTPRGTGPRRKLPRTNPSVQAVFSSRRSKSRGALEAYQEAHP